MRHSGYLHLRGVLDDHEVERIRVEAEAPALEPYITRRGRLSAYYTRRAKGIVEGLFGRPVLELGPTLIPKQPHEGARGWHQDMTSWGDPRALLRDPLVVGVLFYPQGSGGEDGGELRVIPESHVTWTDVHDELERLIGDHFSHGGRDPRTVFPSPHARSVACDPGDVVLLDARTLHGSAPWRGAGPRPAVNVWCWLEERTEQMEPQPYPLLRGRPRPSWESAREESCP